MSKSLVWQYYERGRADDNRKIGPCRLCETKIKCSQSSTSGLWIHLQRSHLDEYEKLKNKSKTIKEKSQGTHQQTLVELMSNAAKYKPDHPKQKKFDRNMIDMIIHSGVPFSLANSVSFKELVKDLDPRIKIKERHTYSKCIKNMEKSVKAKIKMLIKNNARGFLGLTSDLWDDKKQNAFCSLTVHYMNNKFELVRVTSAIKFFGSARHTSENIADTLATEIKDVISSEDNPVVVLTTDSTNSMVKAWKLLVDQRVVDQQLGCANHKLQNCIKKAFRDTENVTKVLTKAKKLAKHIRKSPLANNHLKDACEKTGHKFLRMKSCIDIRWNTQLDCFDRLLYHRECLDRMERKRQLESVSASVLTRKQWRILEQLVEILKPLKVATKVLESETEPTINRVGEIVFDETERLKALEDSDVDDCVKEFARHLLTNLRTRFPHFGLLDTMVAYSNFLDPRLRGVHLGEINELVSTIGNIERRISSMDPESDDEGDNIDDTDGNDNLTPTAKLLKSRCSSTPSSNVSKKKKSPKQEIDAYCKLPACQQDVSVLAWWTEHVEVLPRLSALASMILAIPASSSASERLFSVAGNIDSAKRGNMKLETLETLTLLKTNKKVLEENKLNVEDILEAEIEYEDGENDVESSESELESGSDEGDEVKEDEERIASVAEDSDNDSD